MGRLAFFQYVMRFLGWLAPVFFLACSGASDNPLNDYGNSLVAVNVIAVGDEWSTDEDNTRSISGNTGSFCVPVYSNLFLNATWQPDLNADTRAVAVAPGVRYRVIAYEVGDVSASGYVAHADYTVGETLPSFSLPVNCTYTLVCYSYGSSLELPPFDRNSIFLTTSPSDTDFMYCKKEVVVTETDVTFSILFSHLFSKVTVIADASAAGSAISACTATLPPGYDTVISLAEGSMSKGSSAVQTLNWSSLGYMTVTSEPAMVYTGGEELTLQLQSVTLASLPEAILTNKSVTFVGKVPEPGKSYVLRVSFTRSIPPPAGYTLVWQDEFEQPRLSGGRPALPSDADWWYEIGDNGWGNNELQNYVPGFLGTDTCAAITDGTLKIIARKVGDEILSARMNTTRSWTYGYFEARMKLPVGKGTWPAFWMMAQNSLAWPDDGEIDIMEEVGYLPDWILSTIHCTAYNHAIGTQKSAQIYVSTAQSAFHVYGTEWTSNYIKTYVDGQLYFAFYNDGLGSKATWPFYVPFYLKLNLAWGGDWAGSQGLDETCLPATYEIDYVRVYQK